jgi:hydroxymethylglutaryl-CoA lyase
MLPHIHIYEQFLRDGLQSLPNCYSVSERYEMFTLLNNCGLKGIEFGSTTHPKIVPQMEGSYELWNLIKPNLNPNTTYTMLTPSITHLDKVLTSDITSIGLVLSISDDFAYKNMRMSSEQTFVQGKQMIDKIPNDVHIRIYLSYAFDTQLEILERITRYTKELTSIALNRNYSKYRFDIVLADTVGKCDVETMRRVLDAIEDPTYIGVHLHVKGEFEQLVDIVLQNEIYKFDTSLLGIGGCPYADRLIGNLSTIPLVKYLHKKGYQTGVNVELLEKASREINVKYIS